MKIVCFGSLNLDSVYQVDHFVQPSETLEARRLEIFCGGKGLNQSVALARAGADVWHAGAIGAEGLLLKERLKEEGIHTEFIRLLDSMKTGHAIIQTDPQGENCILLFGGANQAIPQEMPEAVLDHFQKGDWLVLQNEINRSGELMKLAHEKGMHIAFSPAPMDETVRTYPLDSVDVLFCNRVEASQLLQMKAELSELLDALAARFPRALIVLTAGSQGALAASGKERWRVPAFRVHAVDTTGAGDTFAGYFTALLAEGKSITECLETASAAAALSVQKEGASASIPSRGQVETFLDLNRTQNNAKMVDRTQTSSSADE